MQQPGPLLEIIGFGDGPITNEQGEQERIAYIIFDPAGRPDVADIARVHMTEGAGQATTWFDVIDEGRTLAMHVEVVAPVRCRFSLAVPVPAAAHTLAAGASIGAVVLMPVGSKGPTLQVAMRPEDVVEALDLAKHMRRR